MTRNTKTPWYPGNVEPARIGVYRVKKSYGEAWACWDGCTWSHGTMRDCAPSADAFSDDAQSTPHPVLQWRGITSASHWRNVADCITTRWPFKYD